MSVKKIPPPQLMTGPQFSGFNRWLLELTSILNADGRIDPNDVDGLVAFMNASSAAVAALQLSVAANTAAISALQTSVAANTVAIATNLASITALQARAQVFTGVGAPGAGLGSVGDWYGDLAGGVGASIFIKTTPAVWTAFPF